MADVDNLRDTKDYHLDIPARNQAFHVKGAGALDWGMQNRLARIFNPKSGRTVMLAIDHGYFPGPDHGPRADRREHRAAGAVRGCADADARASCGRRFPPAFGSGVVMRASGGPSILKELSNE